MKRDTDMTSVNEDRAIFHQWSDLDDFGRNDPPLKVILNSFKTGIQFTRFILKLFTGNRQDFSSGGMNRPRRSGCRGEPNAWTSLLLFSSISVFARAKEVRKTKQVSTSCFVLLADMMDQREIRPRERWRRWRNFNAAKSPTKKVYRGVRSMGKGEDHHEWALKENILEKIRRK